MSEAALVYGNRYRSSFNELNKELNNSEQLFYKGEYRKSLSNTLNILKTIDPSITNRLRGLSLENQKKQFHFKINYGKMFTVYKNWRRK